MKGSTEMKIRIIPLSSSLTAAELIQASKDNGISVFDIEAIKDELQLRLAFFHAESAFRDGKNISRDMLLEIMLRAAATRQIKDAIEKIGMKDPKKTIVAYDFSKVKLDEERIKSLLKGKKTAWKQSDSKKQIRKMVQAELED